MAKHVCEIGRHYKSLAGGYSPGMARGEPTKTIAHARAGGETALTVHWREKRCGLATIFALGNHLLHHKVTRSSPLA
jgi:hypothetical protein